MDSADGNRAVRAEGIVGIVGVLRGIENGAQAIVLLDERDIAAGKEN